MIETTGTQMMNKSRIEALSDGLFAIVMTVLIFNIKVPALSDALDSGELVRRLWSMWPLFQSYYLSFAILGMYWISHHALFHLFAKHANRPLTYLNVLFLCVIALVPFSTDLVGQYPFNPIAVTVYGLNVIVIGTVQYWMFRLTISDPRTIHDHVTPYLITRTTVRMLLPPFFALLGIIAGLFHSVLSVFFFAFPILINIIPGSLTFLERLFGGFVDHPNPPSSPGR